MTTISSPARPVKTTRKKKDRTARVLLSLAAGGLLVEIADGELLPHFYVPPPPADFGRAFRWAKFECQGGEVYAVNVGDADHPASCECMGHLRWGHRTVC